MRLTKIIALPQIADGRGRLMFAEDERHIPFSIKRFFTIYDVPAGQTRGGHAHRTQHQFVVMLAGRCTVDIDEGAGKFAEHLDSPIQGLYVPPLIWIALKDFTPGAVCLVLTSAHFDEADYIRECGEFRQIAAATGSSDQA